MRCSPSVPPSKSAAAAAESRGGGINIFEGATDLWQKEGERGKEKQVMNWGEKSRLPSWGGRSGARGL